MSEPMLVAPGLVFMVLYPFSRCTVNLWGEGGAAEVDSWRPGPHVGPAYAPDDAGGDMLADGMGVMILTVIDVHKPGRFPTRVFYTRRWRDPAGHGFGKGALRITTLDAFRRMARGYRHDFEMTDRAEMSSKENP